VFATRKRKLQYIATVCVCLGAAWFYLPLQLRPEAFARIKNGMTQAEVERLVGGPPGNYGMWKNGFTTADAVIPPGGPGSIEERWYDDSHCFVVWFDSNSRVVAVGQRVWHSMPPEWLNNPRRWLGL
jgi:hypothetical protein